MEPRYINPYTDFGFKKLFGTELNKELLISFLNALLDNEEAITDLKYLNGERLGDLHDERKMVFDVYCELANGEKIIVEMQKAQQHFFKDRSIYYTTTPIREQAPRGPWDYHLKNVYSISILNFCFPNDEYPADSFRHEVKLLDVADKHVFYDKLTFLYLEMPKFSKREEELTTMFDKWMFALKNLAWLMERPAALQERVFTRLFEQAEIARYTPQDQRRYEESLKDFRDFDNMINTAVDNAVSQAVADKQHEIAQRLLSIGMPIRQVADMTGVAIEELTQLQSDK